MTERIAIDAEQVRRLLASQFPDLAELPLRAVYPGGWDNRTFRLGQALAVRIPSAQRYADQVLKEHRWLPGLGAALPLSIPQPVAIGAPGGGVPWSWSIRTWLAGAIPSRTADGLGPRIAKALGTWLVALHGVDASHGPPAGPHNFHRGGSLRVYEDEVLGALRVLDGQCRAEALRAFWLDTRDTKWGSRPVWVHGDVAPTNLLATDGELTGVIDFGQLGVGDPACDLAIGWTSMNPSSRDVFRRTVDVDDDTWMRGRAWALWKALITASGHDPNTAGMEAAWRVIRDLEADRA